MYTILFKDLNAKDILNDYFLFGEQTSIKMLPNTNKINVILGSNNSGKSRFIRRLMNSTNIIGLNEFIINEYNEIIEEVNLLISRRFNQNHYLLKKINASDSIENDLVFNNERFQNFKHLLTHLEIKYSEITNKLIFSFSDKKKYFIPTLRTAHSLFNLEKSSVDKSIYDNTGNDFKKIEDDIYLHTYIKNYNLNKNIKVFTGLHLYREILNSRNSKRETRLKFEKFQDFIGDNFFEKKKIDIVAEFRKEDNINGKNDSEIISIDIQGEKETRNLHDLGDGIQALIILMYQIYMAENDSLIFIDEPELNLHPGMQRLFLEQISNNEILKKKNLTYFITTHSNHFLDLTIEKNNVSIYSFSNKIINVGEKKFVIRNVNSGDNEILKSLGVNNSSVFIANCSIWVEGISDRNYIKAFLKSYCVSKNEPIPKEDIDFAFFEYAGSNIDHYLFNNDYEDNDSENIINYINALALSNKIFLLADSDATTKTSNKNKFNRLKKLEENKTNQFNPKIIWEVREIENLLINEIWENVLINFCNSKLLETNREIIIQKISNALNQVISEKYQKKYIGNFLNEIRDKVGKIGNAYIINKSIYENKGKEFGTLTNKRYLSELVLQENISWDIFSKNEYIKNLTEEVYNFIKEK
jgi:predicted ATP-dependent endonuclease of OLD family